MEDIKIKNLGPLIDVSFRMGDFNVLVGPQGRGKSICAQILFLISNFEAIEKEIESFGLGKNKFWDILFSKTLASSIFSKETVILLSGNPFSPIPPKPTKEWQAIREHKIKHNALFVPAHRTSLLMYGYPLRFQNLPEELPFTTKLSVSYTHLTLPTIYSV